MFSYVCTPLLFFPLANILIEILYSFFSHPGPIQYVKFLGKSWRWVRSRDEAVKLIVHGRRRQREGTQVELNYRTASKFWILGSNINLHYILLFSFLSSFFFFKLTQHLFAHWEELGWCFVNSFNCS